MKTYVLKILRGTPQSQYWEEFELLFHPNTNVISALMEIQKNPINKERKKTTPVVWEQGCLEGVCGSCSMLINGIPCQACTALIQHYITDGSNTIILAPLSKFPLIRDLCVDRSRLFEALKKVSAWISSAGTEKNKEFGLKISPELQESIYPLSTCMTCGCCCESCPSFNEKTNFIGPAAISQVHLFNSHPAGAKDKAKRLRSVMDSQGISACGNAQNCVRVCPKNIPLTQSIPWVARETGKQALRDFFIPPIE